MESIHSKDSHQEIVFPYKTILKDGIPVHVRPIRPVDKTCLVRGYQSLSAKSRYLRYSSYSPKLSAAYLNQCVTVDYENHLALCAHQIVHDGYRGIGIARYIRMENFDETAELAITILDKYQNRGVGTILLDLLIQTARANGFRRFGGYVLSDNVSMLSLLRKFGATCSWEGTPQLKIDLPLNTAVTV